jgi:CHASE2 domain-containing sensor protein
MVGPPFLPSDMLRLKTRIKGNLLNATIGAVLTVAIGAALWFYPLGERLAYWSYDFPFLFALASVPEETVIVLMDEASSKELGQRWGELWNRETHARLLDKLREAQCKLVVFDVWLDKPSTEASDSLLARAIEAHGQVVLAANLELLSLPGASGPQVQKPWSLFLDATTNWGVAVVKPDSDLCVRTHFDGTDLYPSLSWIAAGLTKPESIEHLNRQEERWLRYYGTTGAIKALSYYMALTMAPDYFRDKIVFVGGEPKTKPPGKASDLFRTPYTRWDGREMPGVEIQATMFLNLIHDHWLRRMSSANEIGLILLCGIILGFALCLFRPLASSGLAIAGILTVGLFALLLFWQHRTWFSWMVIAGAQIPLAWAWSILAQSWKLAQEKTALEREVATAQALKSSEQLTRWVPPAGVSAEVFVPDHALLRCIGKGSYGEVWLACNAIGIYRAVKIVRLDRFPDAVPYEREFKGMQKFMPISLSHSGMVHLLHVGRNEQAGYFFYIMELGDDPQSGQKIDPQTYSSRNLAKDLQKRKRLPLDECVSLSLTLTDTLAYLHQQRLVHRDIKPSNIIFVNGVPKFADIGLVTDVSGEGKDVTYIGTEGYIPPEGPGSPGADIFSLGKVIYEAGMGRDRRDFPELPDSLVEQADTVEFFELNKIILKACEPDRRRRYQSATEMHFDFSRLQTRLNARGPQKQA